MISLKYEKEILLVAVLGIFCTVFSIEYSNISNQKNHVSLAELQTQYNLPLENFNNNITDISNICISSNMKNNSQDSIIVKLGEEFTLSCKAHRTAGYTLFQELDNNFVNLIAQDYKAPSAHMLGASGTYLFTFKALKEGSDTIKIFTKSAQDKGNIVNKKDYQITVE